METAIIVRGRLTDARHIELDEPISGIGGAVEVVLRSTPATTPSSAVDVFDFIASAVPGARSKEDIDRQIAEERGSWGDQ